MNTTKSFFTSNLNQLNTKYGQSMPDGRMFFTVRLSESLDDKYNFCYKPCNDNVTNLKTLSTLNAKNSYSRVLFNTEEDFNNLKYGNFTHLSCEKPKTLSTLNAKNNYSIVLSSIKEDLNNLKYPQFIEKYRIDDEMGIAMSSRVISLAGDTDSNPDVEDSTYKDEDISMDEYEVYDRPDGVSGSIVGDKYFNNGVVEQIEGEDHVSKVNEKYEHNQMQTPIFEDFSNFSQKYIISDISNSGKADDKAVLDDDSEQLDDYDDKLERQKFDEYYQESIECYQERLNGEYLDKYLAEAEQEVTSFDNILDSYDNESEESRIEFDTSAANGDNEQSTIKANTVNAINNATLGGFRRHG